MEPKDAWQATLGHLQVQLHRATYQTWVEGAEFVAFDADCFTVSVPNAYTKDWLEQRLYTEIQRALFSIYRRPMDVHFTVRPQEERRRKYAAPLLPDAPLEAPVAPSTPASISAPPVEKTRPVHGQSLNPDYTFTHFVVGACNQLAYSAAQAMYQGQKRLYNPLYISSEMGLGKTHLLHAIGHAGSERGLNVMYVTGESFTNELIRAIRTQQTEDFREQYRHVDVLLVDDVQFIAGKGSTQEEFYHTFNALHHQGCQIVLASNSRPRTIKDLDERLRSRFEGGLQVELLHPDFETRLAIVRKKAEAQEVELPLSVADLIANRVRESIRELEGALNRVLARAALTRQTLSRPFAESILNENIPARGQLNLQGIFESIAQYHQLTLDDLLGKERSKHVANVRHIAIYLAREEMNVSLHEIGRAMGGRTHSTVINGYNKVLERLEKEPEFRRSLNDIRNHLYKVS